MQTQYPELAPQETQGTLLIVDDDEINRAILEQIFSPFYAVRQAEDGQEGLEAILAAPEQLCAVLRSGKYTIHCGGALAQREHLTDFPAADL